MILPPLVRFALLLGLSFFLGLAYEDFFGRSGAPRRPGGVRTFPLLAISGGVLYLLDPRSLVPFTAGLLIVGGWLLLYYRRHLGEADETGEPNVGLVVPLLNMQAFVLGPLALEAPTWLSIGATVACVLLLTAREQLHSLAHRLDMKEIFTAGQFLILAGIVLPLLPDKPVTTLTAITPRQVWLALLVVCSLSYASYLAQRYWKRAAGVLGTAALGGLYSSTATTIVLARQAKTQPEAALLLQTGIALATAISYLRFLIVVAVFNIALARKVAPALSGLSIAAFIVAGFLYWLSGPRLKQEFSRVAAGGNPLELGAAAIFSGLFIGISLLSAWAKARYGSTGLYWLAALVGVTDIDPFVLNLAQGGAGGIPLDAAAAAIVIAASSNNVMKAAYAAIFGGGSRAATSVLVLLGLAGAGVAIALSGILL